MFLQVLTNDSLRNDHLGTHKNAYSWAPSYKYHIETQQMGAQEAAFY